MAFRTFADYLRSLDDDALSRIFKLRPDLISPTPPDFASLAVRATSSPSLARAIDTLTAFELQVLEATLVLSEPFSMKEVEAVTDTAARFAFGKLIDLALVYGDTKSAVIPTQVREVMGPEIAGLGPAATGKYDLKKIAKAPEAAKQVLDRLVWGPPRGSVTDIKKPGPGIEWLLSENLIAPVDSKHVVLPREIAIHLRGGKVHKELKLSAPELIGKNWKQSEIDKAAIANISNLLRWVEELLTFFGEEAPKALRAGGLGVRDLKDVSTHLGVDEGCAAFVAELTYLSGLVAVDADETIAPTNNFDLWLTQDFESKWRGLVSLWRLTSRVSGLVGRGDNKAIAALGPELDRVSAATIRNRVLAELPTEFAPSLDSLIERIKWLSPLRRGSSIREDLVTWTMQECEWLGITGLGAISTFGKLLLNEADELGINEALPTPIDHIMIQSDQTAIAPGPLQHDLAQEMSSVADIESRGSATVYRFTEKSIRRGLDHGKTSDEILKFLKKISKTAIPQPLEYLIVDTSRKHGQLRVGAISSYLRCEDPAIVAQIISDKKLQQLDFRQIAPTVIVSDYGSDEVLEVLRSNGYLPAAESAQGILLSGAHNKRVLNRPKPPKIVGEIEPPTDAAVEAAIRTIKVGEKSTARQNELRKVDVPRTSANETLELLNANLKKTLSIGYADNNGGVSHRIIDPVQISLGALIARDHSTGELQTFKIARITGVAPL